MRWKAKIDDASGCISLQREYENVLQVSVAATLDLKNS